MRLNGPSVMSLVFCDVTSMRQSSPMLFQQRAVDSEGRRLDAPCLGLYEVRDAKFARAQMFYFDTTELVAFLARAQD